MKVTIYEEGFFFFSLFLNGIYCFVFKQYFKNLKQGIPYKFLTNGFFVFVGVFLSFFFSKCQLEIDGFNRGKFCFVSEVEVTVFSMHRI